MVRIIIIKKNEFLNISDLKHKILLEKQRILEDIANMKGLNIELLIKQYIKNE
jgi:hypothetical protein